MSKTGMSMATYDIELNTDTCSPYDNAELTITLSIGFKQINPAAGAAEGTYHDYGDAAATSRKIIKWEKGAWEHWKGEFVKSAQRFWDGRFWLINNFPELEFDSKTVRYRPNVWCRFVLIGGDADKIVYNHMIEVVRLHRSETWFGSHSTLYDSLDTKSVKKGTDSAGKPIMQEAHVHEIGHLLGLQHVDVGKATCPPGGDTNAAACYGIADADKKSVMGEGMQLRVEQAMPWRKAIVKVTGKGVVLTPTDWAVKLARHYPRNPNEVLLNAAITNRPRR